MAVKNDPPVLTTAAVMAIANSPGSVGLTEKRRAKAGRLLRRFRYGVDATDRLAPFLEQADRMLDQFIGEVSATAGECGPIAESALHSAAAQKALSMFYSDQARQQTEPIKAMALDRMAADFMDRSRQNSLAALETAVRIARTKPVTPGDPLAAFTTQSTEEV